MYDLIKNFLKDGGKCLLIENGEPVGVVLTVEEYELMQNKSEIPACAEASTGRQNPKSETNPEGEIVAPNPIGEAIAKEMDFPEVSAEISDIESADDVTLEDLGVDELPY